MCYDKKSGFKNKMIKKYNIKEHKLKIQKKYYYHLQFLHF